MRSLVRLRRVTLLLTLLSTLLLTPQPAGAQATCGLSTRGGTRIVAEANQRLTSTELGSDARLRARATTLGPWERYQMICLDPARQIYAIRSEANNRYVTTEISTSGSDYAMLRARATAVGAWERYRITIVANTSSGPRWAIQSLANSNFVTAEIGRTGSGYGLLRARATLIGPWERFIFVI